MEHEIGTPQVASSSHQPAGRTQQLGRTRRSVGSARWGPMARSLHAELPLDVREPHPTAGTLFPPLPSPPPPPSLQPAPAGTVRMCSCSSCTHC